MYKEGSLVTLRQVDNPANIAAVLILEYRKTQVAFNITVETYTVFFRGGYLTGLRSLMPFYNRQNGMALDENTCTVEHWRFTNLDDTEIQGEHWEPVESESERERDVHPHESSDAP